MIIDSHFHLLSMKEKGLETILPSSFLGLECSTEPKDMEERIRLVGGRKDVYLSSGAGPWCTIKDYPLSAEECIKIIEENNRKYRIDAVGECGFDFHWEYGEREKQEELFTLQAQLAKTLNIPLIIHSREADSVLLDNISYIGEKTIMHCFSSSKSVMYTLLDRGAYISFAGNVTYKSNIEIRESAKNCPIDRILYETDSPYLTPVPLRGKLNTVVNTELTLSFLSSLRGEESELIKEQVKENFLSLFNNRESIVDRNIESPTKKI